MSSFSENFQREDTTQGGNTQYDDSAFYSFASTMLLIAIITLMTTIIGHAASDMIVDGVTYEWPRPNKKQVNYSLTTILCNFNNL